MSRRSVLRFCRIPQTPPDKNFPIGHQIRKALPNFLFTHVSRFSYVCLILRPVADCVIDRRLSQRVDANAAAAVSQWLFKPGTKDGQSVDVAVTIEINFRLL